MPQEITLYIDKSSLTTDDPALAMHLLQRLCSVPTDSPVAAPANDGALAAIHASTLPALGAPLGGGKFVSRYWLGAEEFALVDLGALAEISGRWGKSGQAVATTHGDGEANTLDMAEAGSEIAAKVLELGAHIPSALESHLLMVAKQAGLITDLREDCTYWTSSQCSAHFACIVDFEYGWQDFSVKRIERPVRPVRKIRILH
ncbi:hypothetical protein D9M70_396600 [compost metagenome]